jgi:hypothetical protein
MGLPNPAESSAPDSSSPTDNFYSPANYAFYSHQPYKSLDKQNHMIRLLAVTLNDRGELQCKLTDAMPLEAADGTYTAVSYCAGDPRRTRTIFVDGKPFNAFANLAHAIGEAYRYRSSEHEDVEALLWTDQICINQSDPNERSHQVNFMGKIYGCAREVVVCLSTGAEHGDPVFGWIQEVHEHLSFHPDMFQALTVAVSLGAAYECINRTQFTQLMEYQSYLSSNWGNNFLRRKFCDIMEVLKRPWWTRAWVSVCAEATLCCALLS